MTIDSSIIDNSIPELTSPPVETYGMDFPLTNLMAWRSLKETSNSTPTHGSVFPNHFKGYRTLWKYEIGPGMTIRGQLKTDPFSPFEGLILEVTHDLDAELVKIAWDTGDADKSTITIASYDELTEILVPAPVNALAKATKAEAIALLNDDLRAKLKVNSPCLSLTMGIMGLGKEELLRVVEGVATYQGFDSSEDTLNERDFGVFELVVSNDKEKIAHKIAWKIDYYDNNLELNSSDPANPSLTCRIITVSLEGELS